MGENVLSFLEVNKLMEDGPDVYAKYVNYTPYMGGNFIGSTFIRDSQGNLKFVGYPSPQGLLGKARWLARVAVASFITGPKSYKDVEEAFPIEGLGVIEYLFGSVEKGWASPISVELKYKVLCEKPWKIAFECYRAKMRSRKAKCLHNRYNDLLVLGKPAHTTLPLSPHCLEIEIEIFRTPRFKILGRSYSKLFDAFVATVLLTPLLVGLGKASSRGFGRFINKTISHEPSKKILTMIEQGDVKEGIREYLRLWEESLKEIGYSEVPKRYWIDGFIPSLASSLDNRYGAYVTYAYRSIDDAMSRIGECVNKAKWKGLSGLPLRSSGVNLHTWPLGLPRQARSTGYLVYQGSLGNCVAPGQIKKIWKDNAVDSIKANEVRRQSMFIIFPLPNGKIVMLPLPAYDLNLNIDDKAPKKYPKSTLYHVGKHSSASGDFHVVAVRDIVRSQTIYHRCGIDPGGVRDCGGNQKLNLSYEEILKVAYECLLRCFR